MTRTLTGLMALLGVMSLAAAGAQEQPLPQTSAPQTSAQQTSGTQILPLTRLVLFSSGVGYFQHDGTVNGETTAELTFDVDQVNDLLKSLVLRDLDGGSIRSVTYASRDPLARSLASFTIDLTGNPTLSQILDQLRGETITLLTPERVQGTVIGVEEQVTADRDGQRITVSHRVNLLTSDGVRTVTLEGIQGFRIDRPELQRELEQALALLAGAKDLDEKKVGLQFTGQGRRRVSVGYILQTPVWKTTYRLVLGENGEHFLQGWAVVENTTDEDWTNVTLSLVSGRPISFIMDLYEPLYVDRPVVQMELYSSLRPRTYDMATGELKATPAAEAAVAQPPQAPRALARASTAPSPAPSATTGSGFSREEADETTGGFMDRLDQGVAAQATGSEVGDLFQYAIDKPVTLPRQRSALLPIVNHAVSGQRYSLYNENVHVRYPLHALKLKNATDLSLMQGPITIFDGGVYAGDAQINNLPAGAEVFLSYALDLETEVVPTSAGSPEELTAVRIAKGVLTATYKYRKEKTFTITSRADRARDVMIEHAIDTSWTLIEPREPAERTRSHYRFTVPVDAGKTVALRVMEERVAATTYSVSNLANDRIDVFYRSRVSSPAVRQAFERILSLRQAHQEAIAERQRLETRVQEITRDQTRIRENMNRLERDSELYLRYVNTLNTQEDELEGLTERITAARSTENTRKQELDAYLLNLDVQ